ncbi:hypothetical protein D3C71_987780 [compost metagenome]
MASHQQHLPLDALSVTWRARKGTPAPTKQALGLSKRNFQPSLPCRRVSDWRKDCSRVAGSCKSHFRGIKRYYLLAIVHSRIFKNGATARTGAMQLWNDFGMPWLPVIHSVFRSALAIKIKCTWSSVDDISKPVLAPGEAAPGCQSCLYARRASIRRQFQRR